MRTGSEAKAAPPTQVAEAEQPAKKPSHETERPPQAEEVLCTICGMRSCWR